MATGRLLNTSLRFTSDGSTNNAVLKTTTANTFTFSGVGGSDLVLLQGVKEPLVDTDVANKKYVDDIVYSGVVWQDPVKYATVSGTLAGATVLYNALTPPTQDTITNTPDTVDGGSTLVIGDRILVQHGTFSHPNVNGKSIANGYYEVVTVGTGADGEWKRTPNMLHTVAPPNNVHGYACLVSAGTQAGFAFICNSDPPLDDEVGIDPLSFTKFGAPSNVAGSNTQVQYNNSGIFGASSYFTFNSASNTLTVSNANVSTNLTVNTIVASSAGATVSLYNTTTGTISLGNTASTLNMNATTINFSSGVGRVNIDSSNAATTTASGALVVNGGVGVAGNVYVGLDLATNSIIGLTAANPVTLYNTTTTTIDFGGTASAITIGTTDTDITMNSANIQLSSGTTGTANVASSLDASSTTTAALTVVGGVGIGGELYVGGNIHGDFMTSLLDTQVAFANTDSVLVGDSGFTFVSGTNTLSTGNVVIATNLNVDVIVGSSAGATVTLYDTSTGTLTLGTEATDITMNSANIHMSNAIGTVRINSAVASANANSGALVVEGGLGVAGNIYVNTDVYLRNDQFIRFGGNTTMNSNATDVRITSNSSGGNFYIIAQSTDLILQSNVSILINTPDTAGGSGDIYIASLDSALGPGGNLDITLGNTAVSATAGSLLVKAGSSDTGGTAGEISLIAGSTTGAGTEVGGLVEIKAGNASVSGTTSNGGGITITAGSGADIGGNVVIEAGQSTTGITGDIVLQIPNGGTAGNVVINTSATLFTFHENTIVATTNVALFKTSLAIEEGYTAVTDIRNSVFATGWTTRTNNLSYSIDSLAWSEELLLLVGVSNQGTTNVMTRTANGTTWSTSAAPNAYGYNSVAWSAELSMFVAVSNVATTTGSIIMSTNGSTWSVGQYGDDLGAFTTVVAPAAVLYTSLVWSPTLSMFVAVASSGTGNRVMTSSDGMQWVSQVSADDYAWSSVCWSPELNMFVAVASTTTNTKNVMYSKNGISWTTTTTPELPLVSVSWGNQGVVGAFVAVSSDATTGTIVRSSDGVIWTTVTSPTGPWTSVTWNDQLSCFLALGTAGKAAIGSESGTLWTAVTIGASENWATSIWIPEMNKFIATSSADPSVIRTSLDPRTLANISKDITIGTQAVSNIVLKGYSLDVSGFEEIELGKHAEHIHIGSPETSIMIDGTVEALHVGTGVKEILNDTTEDVVFSAGGVRANLQTNVSTLAFSTFNYPLVDATALCNVTTRATTVYIEGPPMPVNNAKITGNSYALYIDNKSGSGDVYIEGNITVTGGISGGAALPADSIQYNDGLNALAGSSKLLFDAPSATVTLGANNSTGNLAGPNANLTSQVAAGSLSIVGGSGTANNVSGGNVTIQGGTKSGSGTNGNVSITTTGNTYTFNGANVTASANMNLIATTNIVMNAAANVTMNTGSQTFTFTDNTMTASAAMNLIATSNIRMNTAVAGNVTMNTGSQTFTFTDNTMTASAAMNLAATGANSVFIRANLTEYAFNGVNMNTNTNLVVTSTGNTTISPTTNLYLISNTGPVSIDSNDRVVTNSTVGTILAVNSFGANVATSPANINFTSFDVPDFNGSTGSQTVTQTSTVYIAGAPTNTCTSVTLSNSWALNVASGDVHIAGDLVVDGSISGLDGVANTLAFFDATGNLSSSITELQFREDTTTITMGSNVVSAQTATIRGADAAGSGNTGIEMSIIGGAGNGTGAGGYAAIVGGAAGATGTGGNVTVAGGASTTGAGGAINIDGGSAATSGVGGSVTIDAGLSAGTDQAGGTITLTAGAQTGTGQGGNIVLTTGSLGTGINGVVKITGITESASNTTGALIITGGLGVGGKVYATEFNAVSDIRSKKNIIPMTDCLERIKKVEGYTYDWKDEKVYSRRQWGVIAQQLEEAGFNDLVTGTEEGKAVNYMGFIPVLIEAVKELSARLEQFEVVVDQQ